HELPSSPQWTANPRRGIVSARDHAPRYPSIRAAVAPLPIHPSTGGRTKTMSGPRSDRRRRRLEDLSDDVVDRMIAILEPFVSPERTARIDAAIASRTRDLVLVLEDLYDDHNASAVLRTAEAFGVLEVHLVERESRFVVN